jgi:protein-S-isoprenylcysteine O-methyltransferase Ste14
MLIRLVSLVSCALGSSALLYFAGFLRNWTAWGVDTAPGLPAGIPGNLALLGVFCLFHSLLARPAVKQRLFGRLQARLSRGVYNLVAGASLGLLMWGWTPLPAPLWDVGPGLLSAICEMIFVAGWGLMLVAICAIDVWHMLGLRQAFSRSDVEPPFSTRGPYRLVRHPIQLGIMMALWASPHMTAGHALLAGVLSAYSVLATLALEEPDLRRQLGQPYLAYCRRVPALLPRLFGRTRGRAQ